VSVVLIIGILGFNLVSSRNTNKIDESLEKSIAVLPFLNLLGDPEQEHVCVGLTDEIINRLYLIESFDKVVSLTTVLIYQDTDKSTTEIAEEMGVNYILQGSFKRIDDELRINAKLIDPVKDNPIWLEDYDRPWEEIITIPSKIALQIADHLKALITNKESQIISKSMTENVEAWDLYRKGLYDSRVYTKNGVNQAIEYFKSALVLDSTFALAYSGLASAHIGRASTFSAELSALDALALAKQNIDKALSINPDLEEAHLWNGFYLLYNNWDFSGAEREYKKAIVGDNPDALAVYVDFLNFTTRHREALEISKRLDQTNPYYPNSRTVLSLYYMGEYEEGNMYLESQLELFTSYNTLDRSGFFLLNTGKYERAIQMFNRAMDMNAFRAPRMLGWMGAAHARLGNHEKSLELIEELREQSAAGSAFFIAVIYAALDDKASALKWLQDAYENHEMEIPWLKTEPQFYALHDEPAFQDLLNKVGFPTTESNLIGK
jgi:TolB-like protein/Tfp pilus assembly protein PilF